MNIESLYTVITSQEAAELWGLSRNTVTHAIKRGSLAGRKSGKIWLVTIKGMMAYRGHGPRLETIPEELRDAFVDAFQQMKKDGTEN